MKIHVDDNPLLVPITGNTLGQVLDAIFDYVEAKRRGVVSLRIDGTSVDYEEIDAGFMARPIDTIQEVDVASETVERLAEQSLNEIDEVIHDLAISCHELSRVFHDTKSTEGATFAKDLYELWNEIAERLDGIANVLGLKPEGIEFNAGTMQKHRSAVQHQLDAMREALVKNDRVSLSDLLEYELAPLAEAEAELSTVLRGHLVTPQP